MPTSRSMAHQFRRGWTNTHPTLLRSPNSRVMTQTMTQMSRLQAFAQSKLLRELVDLVGIEPTTSSMPWKRAPSCATGPLLMRDDAWHSSVAFYSLAAAYGSQTRLPSRRQINLCYNEHYNVTNSSFSNPRWHCQPARSSIRTPHHSGFREQICAPRSLCWVSLKGSGRRIHNAGEPLWRRRNEGVRNIQDLLRELLAAPRLIIMRTTP
jgi:hypothetical protein